MRKKLLLLIFSFYSSLSFSQNLVPNPSFEIYDTCPNSVSQLNFVTNWFQPTAGTSDYFNVCFNSDSLGYSLADVPINYFGSQNAKTGVAYAGFFAYYIDTQPYTYREYLETKLLDSLQTSKKYYFSFYLSLADSCLLATDDIGIYFSNDSIYDDTLYANLPFSPSFVNVSGNFVINKIDWVLVKGEYIAQGGEIFLTIGNFFDDLNSDTTSVAGGGNTNTEFNSAYYYIDNVCISQDSAFCDGFSFIKENESNNYINIYPNPVKDKIFVSTNNFPIENIELYNSVGDLVKRIEQNFNYIDLSDLSQGLYFIKIRTNNKMITKKIALIN